MSVNQVSMSKTPQARNDAGQTGENSSVILDVLSNDLGGAAKKLYSLDQTNPLNAALSASLAGATVSIVNGKILYDPGTKFDHLGAGQTATDTFTYAIQLGDGTISTATVTVTITGSNDAPVAVADTGATDEDSAISVDVLANDSDVDGGTLSIASVAPQSSLGATLTIVNGKVQYDPSQAAQLQALNNGQSVTDTFTYQVSDGQGGLTTATASITVTGKTDGAVADSFATSEDNRIYLDVLANDIGSGKSIVGLNGTSATTGTTALGAEIQIFNGQIFYNPQNAAALQALNTGQNATDTFTYTMRDSNGIESQATVTVDVSGFTEGTVIVSGTSGVMTFDKAAANTFPQSYTEAGMTVQSLYNPNSSPHLHFVNQRGDPTTELMNHSGCCSTPYEFRYFNPANGDTTFSVQGFDQLAGPGGVWTSSKGGSVVVGGPGWQDFSTNPLFQDVEWVRWDGNGFGPDAIDNFTFNG